MAAAPRSEPPRCDICGFHQSDWTARDSARTLAVAAQLVRAWTTPDPRGARDELDARGSRVLADIASARDSAEQLHALWHGLVLLADTRRTCGQAAPRQRGRVAQLNMSAGGAPKTAVGPVTVDRRGLIGDVQATRAHHGRPWQALSLWSAEVIDTLAAEGHPIEAGAAGENITITGLDWTSLCGGSLIEVGSVRCQLSAPAVPCKQLRRWFRNGDISRIDHELHPGSSRWYASVVRSGAIAIGNVVYVEPAPDGTERGTTPGDRLG